MIPPETAALGQANTNLVYNSTAIKVASYQYTYDEELRLHTKIIPGCQAYTYYYDDLDQLVLTIDGNGFKTFSKYDRLGRVILTGQYLGDALPNTSQKVYEQRTRTAPHYYTTTLSFPADGMIDI